VLIFLFGVFCLPVSMVEASLKNCRPSVQAILVPGLFQPIDKISRHWNQNSSSEIPFVATGLKTRATIEENAKQLRDQLTQSSSPVILVSWSRGSADVLHSLLTYPEIRSHVLAWISFNGFVSGGSFLLDDRGPVGRMGRWGLSRAGLPSELIRSLSHENRRHYFDENKEEIDQLMRSLAMIFFGSQLGPKSILRFFLKRWSRRPHDGVLEWSAMGINEDQNNFVGYQGHASRERHRELLESLLVSPDFAFVPE
jgi:hypothetical protein